MNTSFKKIFPKYNLAQWLNLALWIWPCGKHFGAVKIKLSSLDLALCSRPAKDDRLKAINFYLKSKKSFTLFFC